MSYQPWWYARPHAHPEMGGLPRVAAAAWRTRAIRTLFLRDFRHGGELPDILEACQRAGLLDDLAPITAQDVVRKALRGIAEHPTPVHP